MSETLTVNMGEAKTRLSQLVALAELGNDVVIARHGRAAVRLEPVEQHRPQFGTMAGMAAVPDSVWFEPMSAEELALWEDGPVFPEEKAA